MPGIGNLLKQWLACVNLDIKAPEGLVDMDVNPTSGEPKPSAITRLMQLVLRQALEDRASAIHLCFHENEHCLRILEYAVHQSAPAQFAWREMVPVPGGFGRPLLVRLRKAAGVGQVPGEGRLYFRHAGKRLSATCLVRDSDEMCVYFVSPPPLPPDKRKGDVLTP